MISLRPHKRSAAPTTIDTGKKADVIVIGRNDAEHLKPCLLSILRQTIKPAAMIYIDDASNDGSAAIARKHGFTTKRLSHRAGMSKARMKGVSMCSSEFVLFMDSDNILPPDYLETMLSEIGDNFGLVYPGKTWIGNSGAILERLRHHPDGLWIPPEADRGELWNQNHVDTCALMRRETFLAAGGWRDNPADTMFDWDLALRMSAIAPYRRSKALLGYRVHDHNWSARERGITIEDKFGRVRMAAASITVACMWSGRIPELKNAWVKSVKKTLAAAGKTARLHIYDDSKEGFGPITPDKTITSIMISRVRRDKGTEKRRPDRRETAEFLASVCNAALDQASSDIIWFIEDDVIVPMNAAGVMLKCLLGSTVEPRTAVGGWFRNRHCPKYFVAANVTHDVAHRMEASSFYTPVDFTGTGCLMILRDKLKGIRFGTEWRHGTMRSPAHDWVFAWRLKQAGTPVIMAPVMCRHYTSKDSWV